jgi:hypothetical protein
MTTARYALRTTSIFRFRTLENNLNFLNQSKHVYWHVTLKLIYNKMDTDKCLDTHSQIFKLISKLIVSTTCICFDVHILIKINNE